MNNTVMYKVIMTMCLMVQDINHLDNKDLIFTNLLAL